jgi:hypothetical protein
LLAFKRGPRSGFAGRKAPVPLKGRGSYTK